MGTTYGLGAIPSGPDERDLRLERLLRPSATPLPSRFDCQPLPPVMDQGETPECVAYACAAMKSYEEAHDPTEPPGWIAFDADGLYKRCKEVDGFPSEEGTQPRVALRVLRREGINALAGGGPDPRRYEIKAYYRCPVEIAALQSALMQFGPLVVAMAWYDAWFSPARDGTLPPPTGEPVGGHAVLLHGWDQASGFLVRNSWGRRWGHGGDFTMPFSYLPAVWEAWKTIDASIVPDPGDP